MDTAHYISPFAISLRLTVDTHRGTRERRPRVAGCIPSVVLTNVRPKIRLTGPGPAFTSPPLQRSPAPFLVSRRSSRSAFNFNTYVRNLTQRAEQSPNPFATWDKWKLCATPKHFCHCWRCHGSRLRIDARDLRVTVDTWLGLFRNKLDKRQIATDGCQMLSRKSVKGIYVLFLLTNRTQRLLFPHCVLNRI